MTGKGSNRRPTDEAAFAEGFDRIFGRKLIGKKLLGSSSTVEQATLTGSAAGSSPASPANSLVYVDDASGMIVDEDFWP